MARQMSRKQQANRVRVRKATPKHAGTKQHSSKRSYKRTDNRLEITLWKKQQQ